MVSEPNFILGIKQNISHMHNTNPPLFTSRSGPHDIIQLAFMDPSSLPYCHIQDPQTQASRVCPNHMVVLSFPREKPWNPIFINSHHALPRIVTSSGESSMRCFKFLTPSSAFGHTRCHEGLVVHRSTKSKNLALVRPHMCSHMPLGFLHSPPHTSENTRASTNRRTLLMSLWYHPMTSHMLRQQPRKFRHVNLSPR